MTNLHDPLPKDFTELPHTKIEKTVAEWKPQVKENGKKCKGLICAIRRKAGRKVDDDC